MFADMSLEIRYPVVFKYKIRLKKSIHEFGSEWMDEQRTITKAINFDWTIMSGNNRQRGSLQFRSTMHTKFVRKNVNLFFKS